MNSCRIMRNAFSALLVFIVMASFGSTVYGGTISEKLKTFMQGAGAGERIPVIIRLSGRADLARVKGPGRRLVRSEIVRTLRTKAEQTQGPLRAFLAGRKAAGVKSLWVLNGIAALVSEDLVPEIAEFPGVESVALDEVVRAPGTLAGTASIPEWNISAVNAPALWSLGFTGKGVVVASMDTGVDADHPDLKDRWRGGSNSWYDPNGEHDTPFDADGHGTGAMSVILGGDSGGTSIGVAPGAKWIAVKIFSDAGAATLGGIHEGFQWLLDPDGDPDTDDAPDVVNNSWGLENVNSCSLEFEADLGALKAAGIADVFSAGNSGPAFSTSISPANNPDTFSVGAVDQSLGIAYFSSRGPSACGGDTFPALVAPGVDVRVADLTSGGLFPDSYHYVNGTSFSAPHVTGAFALLREAFPGMRLGDLEAALKQSAVDLGAAGPDNIYGAGLVDVKGAYNLLLPRVTAAPSSLAFGAVTVGTDSPVMTVTVTNDGFSDVLMGQVVLGGSNPGAFVLKSDSCSLNSLAPKGQCTIDVLFRPGSTGLKEGSLSLGFQGLVAGAIEVPLTGSGILCPVSFEDVPPDYWAYRQVITLACNGITAGCGGGNYCPDRQLTRAETAVFLIKALGVPPVTECTGQVFGDINKASVGDVFCRYVERFAALEITLGCGGGNYCPDRELTRAETAVFLVKALGVPTAAECTGQVFGDINKASVGDVFCRYIEEFAALGITVGCGGGNYCPEAVLTRAQAAAFVVKAFLP